MFRGIAFFGVGVGWGREVGDEVGVGNGKNGGEWEDLLGTWD